MSASKTGLVINPGSPPELREAMQFLIDNPKVAANMGKNAKKLLQNTFSVKEACSRILESCENL